jgi:hypothetical protein
MKTTIIKKQLALFSIFLLLGAMVMAQSKEQDQKAEQQAAMDAEMRAKKEMLEQQEKEMKQLEYRYEDLSRSAERSARSSSRSSARSSSGSRAYVVSSGDHSDYFVHSGFSQNSQTQLTLRNSFDGTSNSSKGQFEVDENTRQLRVMINGKVKSGEIRIIVDYPNGDTFKDLVINSAAEITFSQSVSISEEDQDSNKYIGDWNYKVIAEDAKGNYMLQIQTH